MAQSEMVSANLTCLDQCVSLVTMNSSRYSPPSAERALLTQRMSYGAGGVQMLMLVSVTALSPNIARLCRLGLETAASSVRVSAPHPIKIVTYDVWHVSGGSRYTHAWRLALGQQSDANRPRSPEGAQLLATRPPPFGRVFSCCYWMRAKTI